MSNAKNPDLQQFVAELKRTDGLEINSLEKTLSIVAGLAREFRKYGWTVKSAGDATKDRIVLDRAGVAQLRIRGGKVWRHSDATENICKSKDYTKKFLELSGIPVARGADFASEEFEIAVKYLEKLATTAVVKPSNSGGSRGVTSEVRTRDQLQTAWDHALRYGIGRRRVVLEEFVPGIEIRVFVVGDEAVGAIVRLPPFVVGDGIHSVQELCETDTFGRANSLRYSRGKTVPDWEYLKMVGVLPTSVLEEDEILFVNPRTMFGVGGVAAEIGAKLDPATLRLAVEATRSIPGLEIAGIDMMVSDLEDVSTARVIEVNTAAATDLHRYPAYGKPVALEIPIADYFVRTIENEKSGLANASSQ